VALAIAGSRFQITGHELLDSFQRRNFSVDYEWLDPVLVEIFGGTPSHAITEHGIAILECRHNAGVVVGLVVMPVFAFAFSLGVGGECVGANRAVANVVAIDIEDDEALRSAEMMRDGYAICGSDCYPHSILLLNL
jgi:hypothetical protein